MKSQGISFQTKSGHPDFIHHVTYAAAKFKLLHQMIKDIHLQENSIFDLDHSKCCSVPLHHVIYSPTKFEVATSIGLGGDAFTRN